MRDTFFRHKPSERRGTEFRLSSPVLTSLFTERQGDGNNVFGENVCIENNYERRKEVRFREYWWVKVLFSALC